MGKQGRTESLVCSVMYYTKEISMMGLMVLLMECQLLTAWKMSLPQQGNS